MSADRIRELNDAFRTTFAGGFVNPTAGVRALDPDTKRRLLTEIRGFKDFSEDNDPHGEHDFGRIELQGSGYFFKLDYYDLDMAGGSEDPADPEKTRRVLTVMRAEEY